MTPPRKRRPTLRPLARLTGRDAVWSIIRELAARPSPEFTAHDIMARMTGGTAMVNDYIRRLAAAGIVEVLVPATRNTRGVYRLVQDHGVEPPRVNAAGTIDNTPSEQERLWQAMKVLRTFIVTDLLTSTGIQAPGTVRSYVWNLTRAGYLAVVEPAGRGTFARYALLASRNTGPRAPAVRRGGIVLDQNTGAQMWPVP
ncbi:hypothetical protein ACQW02_25385 [Humitalea sp. 24SJ18S-53]|uniref:hypothetical protein n=1 Tax=Humitalea sp. 24SJ18S-53 TaxID=3422307 RepID=UPI003D668251